MEEKYFFNFLLGVIDGDGYISGEDYLTVGIVNSNLKFLKYVQESLSKYDIKTHIHAEDKWKYRLTAVGENADALLSKLYKSAPVYLRRKYVIYKQYTINTGLAN
ncbi:LAGLIDADG family homing endonuclease [Limosilactobacillus reuteri]|uniref:LAGLIDADG family homing endonuclease n=1 Tax=Limosilactobacillus reuteri TaxID=1598 RepID=UPI002B051D04|nr:LAGLIDADG family homing endonuclease [Limosilactobacillus reuteri]